MNKYTLTVMLVVLCAALAAPAVQAVRLYKWVDQEGNVSYHDRPPPSDAGYRVESKDFKVGGRPTTPAPDDQASAAAEKFPVVLYSAPKCASCDRARAYLEKRGVPFTDKNVDENFPLQAELREKTGSLTVPTIMVGDKVMKGYLQSLLAGELDAAGYPKIETAQSKQEQEQ